MLNPIISTAWDAYEIAHDSFDEVLATEDTPEELQSAWNVFNGSYEGLEDVIEALEEVEPPLPPPVDEVPVIVLGEFPVQASGTITISANITDDHAIADVQFRVDGNSFGNRVGGSYVWSIDTTLLDNGDHLVSIEATDDSGQKTIQSSTLTVMNVPPDLPPSVNITYPTAALAVNGSIFVKATANDDHGVLECWLQLDGTDVANSDDFTAPYEFMLDTTTLSNGQHLAAVIAKDTAFNKTISSSVMFTVSNAAPDPFPLITGRAPLKSELVNKAKLKAYLTSTYPTTKVVRSGGLTNPDPGNLNVDITSGSLVITRPGTYRNFRISSSADFVVQCRLDGVVLEDFEIVGNSSLAGIGGWGVFRRGIITGCENAVNNEKRSEIDRCVIVEMKGISTAHIDGVQNDGGGGGCNTHHSYIDIRNSNRPNGETSAVMNDNYFGTASNSIVDYNFLAGGGFTVYFDGRFKSGTPMTGCALRYNRIVKGSADFYFAGNAPGLQVIGNVNDVNGAAI